MKAKEIVASIKNKISSGENAHQAFTDELVADTHRMRAQNEDRKGHTAALLRLLREYNQKWNAVIAGINELPEFQVGGKTYLIQDDFVRMVLSAIRHGDPSSVEVETNMVLGVQTITNQAIRDHQRQEKVAKQVSETLARVFFGV